MFETFLTPSVFLLKAQDRIEGYYTVFEAVRTYTTMSAAQAAADAANAYEATRPEIDWTDEASEEKTRRRLKRWKKKHPEKSHEGSECWVVEKMELRE